MICDGYIITGINAYGEQHFSVDPANVGEYDRDSALYQRYTSSFGNTEISPEIREMAQRIAGSETNPYLAARKLYDYIVKKHGSGARVAGNEFSMTGLSTA